MNQQIFDALRQYIDAAGGAETVGIRVSEKLNRSAPYTRQAVEAWYRHTAVPAEVASALGAVINVHRSQIRPDLWENE